MKDIIAHTKIFDLVLKDEISPGFRPVGIDAPDWVTVIAERKGQFLMTRQTRFGIMREVEEFVCGTVEKGEDPRVTARRELQEETGLVVPDAAFAHLGDISPNPAFMSNAMHVFYVNLDNTNYAVTKANPGEHEVLTSYWEAKGDVFASVLTNDNGNVIPAMKLCAVALYRTAYDRKTDGTKRDITIGE